MTGGIDISATGGRCANICRGATFPAPVGMMLGELIARLQQPDIAAGVLTTLEPEIAARIERRAAAESMAVADFIAGAVREFVDRADDDLWFQLLTIVREAEDPGLTAVRTILQWVVTDRRSPA